MRSTRSRTFVADANFGIMERDVEIAEKLAELKREYGYPRAVGTNYAKNTVKHLKRIVQSMVEAEVLTEGLISLQTMDENTLLTIKRSNIKTEKYDLLAAEFRAAGLPLFVAIMLGLPGSTNVSFRNDLQQYIDREVTAKIFQTGVGHVTSQMNEPEYRDLHKIETARAADRMYDTHVDENSTSSRVLVVSTALFSRSDYDEMLDLRRASACSRTSGCFVTSPDTSATSRALGRSTSSTKRGCSPRIPRTGRCSRWRWAWCPRSWCPRSAGGSSSLRSGGSSPSTSAPPTTTPSRPCRRRN